MPRHAMTPHYSGTTLDAQIRYANGVKEILRRTFDGEVLNETDVIVKVRPKVSASSSCTAFQEGSQAFASDAVSQQYVTTA